MPSSVIKNFHYNAEHARLIITFTTGRVYEYYAVPALVFDDMRAAFSKGTFFNTQIRDHFPFKDVTPPNVQPKRSAR
jgi:hypothetical protein